MDNVESTCEERDMRNDIRRLHHQRQCLGKLQRIHVDLGEQRAKVVHKQMCEPFRGELE